MSATTPTSRAGAAIGLLGIAVMLGSCVAEVLGLGGEWWGDGVLWGIQVFVLGALVMVAGAHFGRERPD